MSEKGHIKGRCTPRHIPHTVFEHGIKATMGNKHTFQDMAKTQQSTVKYNSFSTKLIIQN